MATPKDVSEVDDDDEAVAMLLSMGRVASVSGSDKIMHGVTAPKVSRDRSRLKLGKRAAPSSASQSDALQRTLGAVPITRVFPFLNVQLCSFFVATVEQAAGSSASVQRGETRAPPETVKRSKTGDLGP